MRLDVAVHEPARVRGVERVGDLAEQAERAPRVDAALAQQLGERRPVDELHRQVQAVLGLAGLVDGHDVRVLERRLRAALAAQPRVQPRFGRHSVGRRA